MTNYELLYIISGQFTDNEAKNIQREIDDLLKNNGGRLGHQEFWGKKKLAYLIKKSSTGYYLVTEFELEDSAGIKLIDNRLKLDNRILRAQITSRPKGLTEELARAAKSRAEAKAQKAIGEKTSQKPTREKKVSMKELDEKLDEILKNDNIL